MSPLDAERAFAADAQRFGQWTAFRKWAASDATMFVPQPINAQAWLKDRKDPPKAIEWWPTTSYVSCDGRLAVNTGGWKRPDGSVGYFSTVWQRQQDGGWKWIVDGGDDLTKARPLLDKIVERRADCSSRLPAPAYQQAPPPGFPVIREEFGYSNDLSLSWHWLQRGNYRTFDVTLASPRGGLETVLSDKIAPPK